MNRSKRFSLFLGILLLITPLSIISGAELVSALEITRFHEAPSVQAINRLCEAPSALPAEDVSVPLPGGFFSLYESKQGSFYAPDGNSLPEEVSAAFAYKEEHEALGEVVMILDRMEYDSPYSYTTEGTIRVSVDGSEQIFSMNKIDYVCNGEEGELCYRLACTPESGCGKLIDKMYILGYSCCEDQSVLVGSLSYISQKGELEVAYPFFITGRDDFSAARHLQNKIVTATAY